MGKLRAMSCELREEINSNFSIKKRRDAIFCVFANNSLMSHTIQLKHYYRALNKNEAVQ